MSLLSYQYHASPSSHKDVLQKIKVFAVAQGWTLTWEQNNKYWGDTGGGVYGWLAGPDNEDNLQLTSSGYGSQSIIVRFRASANGVDPQAEWIYVNVIDPNYPSVDTSISNNPVRHHSMGDSFVDKLSQSPASIPAMYLFGNDKFILAIMQMTTTYWVAISFGSIELFDQTRTDGYGSWTSHWTYSNVYQWYQLLTYSGYFHYPGYRTSALSPNYGTMWMEGQEGDGGRVVIDPYLNAAYLDGLVDVWTSYKYAAATNAWTGKRVLLKPTVFYKRRADDLWEPLGTLPFYFCSFYGLTIGEELDYGAETYKIFPNLRNDRDKGMAMRIV